MMKVIDTRFMVTGKRLDNGETIEGQRVTDGKRVWIIYDNDAYIDAIPGGMALISDRYLEVDPASVEPVAVKAEDILPHDRGRWYSGECPTCGAKAVNSINYLFCGKCGQRLDWAEGKDGAE